MRPFLPCALFGVAALSAPGAVQPAGSAEQAPGQAGPPPASPGGVAQSIDQFPPQMRAGVRSELVRRRLPVVPTLVIVSNPTDYLRALAGWSLQARYPVLLDDGTAEARESIARFARGFAPASVVRWSAKRETGEAEQPLTPERIKTMAQEATAAAWGLTENAAEPAALIPHWTGKLGLMPVGIVVADAADPAWPAAVALAAGHGEPICWLSLPMSYRSGPNGLFEIAQLDPIDTDIQNFAQSTGLAWREFGDAIDTVTLCLNVPSRGQIPGAKPYDMFTVSYRVGRFGLAPHYSHGRWACSSQVFGTPAQTAYQAMCSLFLQPRKAWLFDGYDTNEPFNRWDATKASHLFQEAKFDVAITDTPTNSAGVWRSMASRPVPAGVVAVNTSGERDDFNLQPGKLRSADIPFTDEPAAVYFVHSWSATLPADRTTIAGRWFERGAYAYFGSAQEPYLQSFVSTPDFSGRFLSAIPWAVAPRYDEDVSQVPVWKLSCFGDALLTLGPVAPRATAPLPLAGARSLQEDLAPALKEKRFADAIGTLVLLAREQDAVKLIAALMEQQPEAFTPAVAAVSIMPLFRAGRSDLLFRAFDVATTGRLLRSEGEKARPAGAAGASKPAQAARKPMEMWKDAVWLAAYPLMYTKPDRVMLESLKASLRADNFERDMEELGNAWARAYSKGSAAMMLKEVADTAPNADQRSKALAMMQKFQTP